MTSLQLLKVEAVVPLPGTALVPAYSKVVFYCHNSISGSIINKCKRVMYAAEYPRFVKLDEDCACNQIQEKNWMSTIDLYPRRKARTNWNS